MKNKKMLALALALVLVLTAAIGGTLAYFTDRDAETNTFTIGHIDITLNEVFDPENAKLVPGKDINKDVWITLEEGSEDAYVWYEYLIPAVLDSNDGSTGTNNIVHVNALGRTWDTYRENSKYWAEGQTEALALEQTWDHDADVELEGVLGPQGYVGQETIEGVVYNKYVVLYHGKLTAGEQTQQAMDKLYLDPKVDAKPNGAGGYDYYIGAEKIDFDFSQNINIIVRAYGIQAEGFADVYAAYQAYQAQMIG